MMPLEILKITKRMTQHLPTFDEKVETYLRKQREEIEKKEKEEEEKKLKNETMEKESLQATSKIKIGESKLSESKGRNKNFNMINFVDGLAIDSKDKKKLKKEIVKLKAELSYNR